MTDIGRTQSKTPCPLRPILSPPSTDARYWPPAQSSALLLLALAERVKTARKEKTAASERWS